MQLKADTMSAGTQKALVLFSGGQDSTTCLAWALSRYSHVETIGFGYGQRHAVELECRQRVLARFKAEFPQWAARLKDDHELAIDTLGSISETALTREVAIEFTKNDLPSTFVPGRNLIFFTFAAALAYRRELRVLVGGMCETDFSGYPDCRDDTLKALQVTLNLGLASRLIIETPLMWLNKAQSWTLAEQLGGEPLIQLIRNDTHTCYMGSREPHEWGAGCGECPACDLRARGYKEYLSNRRASGAV
jgi:7-cyano-7-deazaguanine synthase